MVTLGVVVFNFGAPVKPGKGGQADSAYGLALIAFSLALDGATGGIQARSLMLPKSDFKRETIPLKADSDDVFREIGPHQPHPRPQSPRGRHRCARAR